MAINTGNAVDDDSGVMVEMNTTPLIDVMLVLLVMLIVTIPIQTHAVKLDMPVNKPSAPPEPPEVVELQIDFDGTVFWDGAAVPNHAALEAKMTEVAAMPDQPEVHIKPNKLAEYGYVANVMASAQRLGVKKMAMVGNEQFLN